MFRRKKGSFVIVSRNAVKRADLVHKRRSLAAFILVLKAEGMSNHCYCMDLDWCSAALVACFTKRATKKPSALA